MHSEASRDFVEFHDLGADAILSILARAQVLAAAWQDRSRPQGLAGKRVAVIADDGGWRNTTAFDLGVRAMGGICVQPPVRFNVHETTADLAGYLDNWFDKGVDTPGIVLIQVKAKRVTYWKGRDEGEVKL